MISLLGIRKGFGPVVALDGVSLELSRGEIHGLLGENGAGKSTLMKVLFGLLRPDGGEIHVDGRLVVLRRPDDARRLGIGMVHQHFMLVDNMTVAQNVLLGDCTAGFWQTPARIDRIVSDAAQRLGLEIDPAAKAGTLSVGQRQRVELLKVLRRPVRTLILDEPTAVLTPAEVEPLFATLRRLRANGCTIVLISHKLSEIMAVCDRVTVLRRGRTIATHPITGVSADELIEEMVGRRVVPASRNVETTNVGAPLPILELANVATDPRETRPQIVNTDLTVRGGEIVGIAGVDGNGQSALVESILDPPRVVSGTIRRPKDGIAHIADDRQREALVLPLSLAENAVLKMHGAPPYSRAGMMRWSAVGRFARELVGRYSIRAPSEWSPVATLSGGNQQKVVVGRELSGEPRLIVAVNPTRGLDIGATDFVRRELLARRQAGAGVVLISSDLDEILALSDRILVLYRGRLNPTAWPAGGVDEIAALMAGRGSQMPHEAPTAV